MNDVRDWEGGVFRCSGFSLFFFNRGRVYIFLVFGDLKVLWREMRRVCFLLLWYHYGLHRLGLFSYGLYVILCIRERVLCVFVQDCQNGGEFARHHLMYLRSRLAFKKQ